MPDHDDMLAQNTIDFRNEERRARFACSHDDVDESGGLADELAFCTLDDECQAEADAHLAGCPVEEQLRREFGF